jgi:hypothetical protein
MSLVYTLYPCGARIFFLRDVLAEHPSRFTQPYDIFLHTRIITITKRERLP